MSVTVGDVITSAFQKLGYSAAGEALSADDAALGLAAINDLIDAFAAERLCIYSVTRTTKALGASVASYTVGTGGDINIVRPVFFDAVTLVNTNISPSLETPLDQLTDAMFEAIPQKSMTSAMPMQWYYNPTFTTARGTLTLWPVPTGSGLQIALYTPTAVAEFSALTDLVSLPPGYRRMLRTNLVLELAPSCQIPVTPLLAAQAAESKATVKRANQRLIDLSFAGAPGVSPGGRYDIQSDRYL